MNILHTPGPWSVGSYLNDGSLLVTDQVADDECIIAMVCPNFIETKNHQRANANLIAAAPDLLRALMLAAKELDINNPDPDLYDESEEAGIIRAAISKATSK